jgi:hypothetical protein
MKGFSLCIKPFVYGTHDKITIILAQSSGSLNIYCYFTSVHSCAFNPTILVIQSIIFFVENSTEMDEVRCLTMKVAVTETGIKSGVAVCKMSCLLLVLSVVVPGASIFILHCHIKCCLADKASIFVAGCSDVF